MLLAMLCAAVLMTTIVVFGLITENAKDLPEKSGRDDMKDQGEGRGLGRNQDRAREQEAQKKIARANAPKKNNQKNPVQQISSIPITKKEKGMASNGTFMDSRGLIRNISRSIPSVTSKKR